MPGYPSTWDPIGQGVCDPHQKLHARPFQLAKEQKISFSHYRCFLPSFFKYFPAGLLTSQASFTPLFLCTAASCTNVYHTQMWKLA